MCRSCGSPPGDRVSTRVSPGGSRCARDLVLGGPPSLLRPSLPAVRMFRLGGPKSYCVSSSKKVGLRDTERGELRYGILGVPAPRVVAL